MISLRQYRGTALCVLVAVCMATASCNNDSVSPDGYVGNDIVPLGVGYRWKYRTTEYLLSGPPSVYTTTTSVDSMYIVDGQSWFAMSTGVLWRLAGDGLRTLDESRNAEILVARFPATVGDTCGSMRETLQGMADTVTLALQVTATDTLISVPAGSFRCVVYQQRYFSSAGKVLTNADHPGIENVYDDKEFFAPGVGRVKSEFYRHLYPNDSAFLSQRTELLEMTK